MSNLFELVWNLFEVLKGLSLTDIFVFFSCRRDIEEKAILSNDIQLGHSTAFTSEYRLLESKAVVIDKPCRSIIRVTAPASATQRRLNAGMFA